MGSFLCGMRAWIVFGNDRLCTTASDDVALHIGIPGAENRRGTRNSILCLLDLREHRSRAGCVGYLGSAVRESRALSRNTGDPLCEGSRECESEMRARAAVCGTCFASRCFGFRMIKALEHVRARGRPDLALTIVLIPATRIWPPPRPPNARACLTASPVRGCCGGRVSWPDATRIDLLLRVKPRLQDGGTGAVLRDLDEVASLAEQLGKVRPKAASKANQAWQTTADALDREGGLARRACEDLRR